MPTFPLAVSALSKHFGPFRALDEASFQIHHGELLGLIGPNGSGKTTLFECVAGLLPPTSGSVRTADGQDIPAGNRKRLLYFVPDDIRPWPAQSVSWVLHYAAELFDRPATVGAEILRQLALAPFGRSALGELSKGEHRRVMLAIGLLSPQPLLMLDEPFDGLDLRQTRDVMQVLREHAEGGRTLFLSIHQLADAARVCDRLVLLSGGRTVGTGTVDELRGAAHITGGGLDEVFLALT